MGPFLCEQVVGGFGVLVFMVVWFFVQGYFFSEMWSSDIHRVVWIAGGFFVGLPLMVLISWAVC